MNDRSEDVVQVEFEDSPDTVYTYRTGGLKLEVGDLVVTPAPSSAGRFGYQRYNRQGVAAVVGRGPGSYAGPLKTLLGKITTKSGKTKKARWYRDPLAISQALLAGGRVRVKEPNTTPLPPFSLSLLGALNDRLSRLEVRANRAGSGAAVKQLQERFDLLERRIRILEGRPFRGGANYIDVQVDGGLVQRVYLGDRFHLNTKAQELNERIETLRHRAAKRFGIRPENF